jgi:16S rRNA (guanine527-N7)-methyltransferase
MTPLETRLALTEGQRDQLEAFRRLATEINLRHNLYSRSSAEHFWDRHILHSLLLASRAFPPGAQVVDWGTGGGLPGIPLAIVFPEVDFVLVDAVQKKIRAIETMARRLGIPNVTCIASRAEQLEHAAHFAVSRATAPLADLWDWTTRVIEPVATAAGCWQGQLITLKGGALSGEIAELRLRWPETSVLTESAQELLPDPYFAEKQIVSVAMR